MTTTEQGFLAAICAEPAEDVHRLVFADWLDDHHQPERAEFIRVQCEIASDPRTYHAKSDFSLSVGCTCSLCKLRRREDELIRSHMWKVLRDELPAEVFREFDRWTHTCDAADRIIISKRDDWRLTFSRGFVSRVRCRLEDWIGIRCEPCQGAGGANWFVGAVWPWLTCSTCQGTGRSNAHGREIVQCQPVSTVQFTERPNDVCLAKLREDYPAIIFEFPGN